MSSFWTALPRPFFVQAPLYDVTDAAFRQVIAQYGRPHAFYTEFVSVAGLASPVGRSRLLRELYFTPSERPIVAQVFGNVPEQFFAAGQLVRELGFDGIDINTGCPDDAVVKQGSGAALSRTPERVAAIVAAAKAGADGLPVSVKCRIGYNTIDLSWVETILATRPAALALHLRTKKEMSRVPAHWELLPEILKLPNPGRTLILGNGDVRDLADAREKIAATGCDGVMLGRAIFGNPWLYSEHQPTPAERIAALAEHIKKFAELYRPGPTNDRLFSGHTKSFAVMKKHFKAYISGWSGAGELRAKLMAADTPEAALESLIDA